MSTLTVFSAIAASALLASIWQGFLLAVAVALCLRLVPAIPAAARSVVWLTVFGLVFLLHFVQASEAQSLLGAPRASNPLTVHFDPGWGLVLAAGWLCASLVRAVQLAASAVTLHRLARRATPVDPPVTCIVPLAASRRPESSPAQLCVSPEVDRPSVLGFFRPRILLPPGLLETLSPAELGQVLLHETEHLRRRDDWTNLLQKLALVIFPLHPVLLWIERRLAQERELACDDCVLQATGARKAYASCLARLAEQTLLCRRISLALAFLGFQAAWQHQSELARRVTRILSRPGRTLSPRISAALVTVLTAFAAGGSFELAHSPQLISFTSTTFQPQFAVASSASRQFLPVTYHPRTQETRFTTAKAVLNARNTPAIPALPRHPTNYQLRPAFHSAAVLKRPSVRLTSFHSQPSGTSVRLTFTVGNPNQFSYAAVSVPGGWILVPLQIAQPTSPILTLSL